MASAFHELMLRLGYPRYVSQGAAGARSSRSCSRSVPPRDSSASTSTCPGPSRRTSSGTSATRLLHFYRDGFGYAAMMNQSPQTLGYALADSPVGMAAYYSDKFAEWTDSGGEPEKVLASSWRLGTAG